MEILSIPVKEINPAAYNPRKDLQPGDPEYEKLKKSILEFDMVEPLVWNKRTGNLVGGHQRLKILEEMGQEEVDVSVVDLSPGKEKALNLALNKIQGDWDLPKLKDLLEELNTGELDIEITGFDEKEIEALMTQFHIPGEGLTDDDEVPEPKEAICKAGDLWGLDNHRLLCGDATVEADVARLMANEKADMVFTDPPYGVKYVGTDWKGARQSAIQGDTDTSLYYPALIMYLVFSKVTAPIYLWFADKEVVAVLEAIQKAEYVKRATLIWNKNHGQFGAPSAQYHTKHESMFYLHRKGKSPLWYGNNNEVTVWDCSRAIKNEYHPTQKPVELAERAIANSTQINNIVSDLFGGSGSTLIACEKLDRRCFMMEIDEHYCDVIIQRWQDFTGLKAEKLNGN